MAQASRPRSRFGLALPRLVWTCMHAGLLPLMHGSGITPSLSPRLGSVSPRMAVHACKARCPDAWLRPHPALALAWFCLASYGFAHACWACCLGCMAQASRPRSRFGLALPRRAWLWWHARLAASDAWLRPHLALALAWLCLASYGFVCMPASLPLTHGSGLTPSLSPWLGSASPGVLDG